MTEPASLVGKFRLPLDAKSAGRLARNILEHRPAVVTASGLWLEVHACEEEER